jgi:hypothetical protein
VTSRSEETRCLAYYAHFGDLLNSMMSANTALYAKIVDDPSFHAMFREYLFQSFSKAVQQVSH